MSERRLRFGDVVRVDPEKNPRVAQPDNRRWMVVACARTHSKMPWTLIYVGPNMMIGQGVLVSHWNSLYGFCPVDE